MADTLREVIEKAVEEAVARISVGFEASGLNATVLDAIANWRHETDTSGALDLIHDQSGDVTDAILTALRSWEPSEEIAYLAAQQIKTSYENENSMVDGASAVWRAMLEAAIKEGRDA
ncbi:MAG TPA: hypothetical protein PKY87_02245 [Terricaulis sp.]|nr:hypothetical protein [Terricaulis sp.]